MNQRWQYYVDSTFISFRPTLRRKFNIYQCWLNVECLQGYSDHKASKEPKSTFNFWFPWSASCSREEGRFLRKLHLLIELQLVSYILIGYILFSWFFQGSLNYFVPNQNQGEGAKHLIEVEGCTYSSVFERSYSCMIFLSDWVLIGGDHLIYALRYLFTSIE